jgi:UDP-glucose 4-epimerase
MRWLITGGCGFIGRNLINNLVLEGGHAIRVVDNLKVGSREDLAMVCSFKEAPAHSLNNSVPGCGEVELVVGDILNAHLALQVCEEFDVVVHLAANTGVAPSVENPRMDCETNVLGTLNYLEAARHCKVKRFVFASSGAPAGEVNPPIHEELPPHPVSPYGASKLAGEGYCSAYFRTFGVETVCLRFGNVYGPLSGKKDSVIAKFIKRALDDEPLEIYGDGTQTRDFIYVEDLIRSIRLSVNVDKAAGETFQIATNQETTIHELVEKLASILKKSGIPEAKLIYGSRRKGDVMRNFSDTSKASKILGWSPSVNLDQGLIIVIQWFLDRYLSKNDQK